MIYIVYFYVEFAFTSYIVVNSNANAVRFRGSMILDWIVHDLILQHCTQFQGIVRHLKSNQ